MAQTGRRLTRHLLRRNRLRIPCSSVVGAIPKPLGSIIPRRQQQSGRWFSSGVEPEDFDPYDRYRSMTITEDVWGEIQKENEKTRRSIDRELYEQVLKEIFQGMGRLQKAASPEELGPTGKYLYSFHDNQLTGQRQYKRRSVSSASASGDESFQTVVEFSANSSLIAMSLSPDETLVACLLTNDETMSNPNPSPNPTNKASKRILLRNIDSGTELEIEANISEEDSDISSIELGPIQSINDADDIHSLFFVTDDHMGRPHAVWGCSVVVNNSLGSLKQCSPPILLYRSTDPATMVSVQRTKGCHYVAIQASTKSENEIYLCKDLKSPLLLVCERSPGIMYHLDVGIDDDLFLLISSDDDASTNGNPSSPLGVEYSLWNTSVSDLPLRIQDGQCGNLIKSAHGDEYAVVDMDIFEGSVALYERSTENGKQRLRILPRTGENCESDSGITVPIFGGTDHDCVQLSPGGNMHYKANNVRFAIESPASPPCVYEYVINSEEVNFISGENISMANIRQERHMVTSQDGTKVPLSLIYRENANPKSNTLPAVLIGYGSYGEPLNLSFNPALVPLLKRGYVLAYAHVRGGGDLGKKWYHQGRLYQKKRAVEDYVACALALCSDPISITEPRKLTALGYSAAGVILGAAVNEHPGAFGNLVLTNCFLDVKKTMENKKLFLTEHEYDEYGNPTADPEAAKAISSYCPVSNASNVGEHTARFLITGAFDDHQVPFYNSLIYGKKVRQQSRVKNRVHIYIESHGGHDLHPHVAALQASFIIGSKSIYYGFKIDDD